LSVYDLLYCCYTSINGKSNPVTLYVDEIVGKEMTDETLGDTVIKRSKARETTIM